MKRGANSVLQEQPAKHAPVFVIAAGSIVQTLVNVALGSLSLVAQ